MCGRFFLVAPAGQVLDAFGLSPSDPGIADPGDDPSQRAAAILTRASAGPVKGIHERMPLVIEPDDFDAWLDPNLRAAEIQDIISRASDRTASMELECFEVGRGVSKAT